MRLDLPHSSISRPQDPISIFLKRNNLQTRDKSVSSISESNTGAELISPSKGFAIPETQSFQDFEELDIEESLRSEEIYCFYYVMWIRCGNGIVFY